MFKKSLVALALFGAGISNVSAIPYGLSDARSVAMGNVSVATGGVTTAAFANPAMLTVNEGNDTFAFHIGVGALVLENGSVTDDIDRFQAIEDQINAIDTSDVNNASQLLDLLNQEIAVVNDLDGDSLVVRAVPNMALIYGGDHFSLAATLEYNAFASGAISDITGVNPLTLAQVENDINTNGTLTFNPSARLRAVGVITQELGVSIATSLNLFGLDVSLGVRPKTVTAKGIYYDRTLETADAADIVDEDTQDLGSFTTMDAGAVINFTKSFRVGLVAKNLMSETLTVNSVGGQFEVDFDTQMRAGIAYRNSFMTLAADVDLTESDPILLEDKTRMAALGVELNAFDFMQIRGGYQTNLASGANTDDILSAGVGFWLGFNLDIAAVSAEDSLGFYVQTGFRF